MGFAMIVGYPFNFGKNLLQPERLHILHLRADVERPAGSPLARRIRQQWGTINT
jgi:hypothetical protein